MEERSCPEGRDIETASLGTERALDDVVEAQWLAWNADGKELFARAELLRLELEGLQHSQALLSLDVHVPTSIQDRPATTGVP